jgi:hypothetical protein
MNILLEQLKEAEAKGDETLVKIIRRQLEYLGYNGQQE